MGKKSFRFLKNNVYLAVWSGSRTFTTLDIYHPDIYHPDSYHLDILPHKESIALTITTRFISTRTIVCSLNMNFMSWLLNRFSSRYLQCTFKMRDKFSRISSCSINLSGNLVSRFAISMSYFGLNFAGSRVTCLAKFNPRKTYVQFIDYLGAIQKVRNAKNMEIWHPTSLCHSYHISHDIPSMWRNAFGFGAWFSWYGLIQKTRNAETLDGQMPR